jgi:hypothetical protein
VDALLAEATCEGAAAVQDAVVIPASSNELLVSRLVEMVDEVTLNKTLFEFLARRASDAVLRDVVSANPEIVRRESETAWRIRSDGRINLFARLHDLRLLPDDLRDEIADELEYALFDSQDSTALEREDILAIFPPQKLLVLSIKIHQDLVEKMPGRIKGLIRRADLTVDPSDNFDELKYYLNNVESVFSDVSIVVEAVAGLLSAIEDGIANVTARKKAENKPKGWVGENIVPRVVTAPASGRSIFSDVDL